jgi:hypothetical protein
MIVEAVIKKFRWCESRQARTTAACTRCGLQVMAWGTKKESTDRCKLKLQAECRRGESNLYVKART